MNAGFFTTPDRLQWLYVDFNSYFASVEQQMNPALRGKPVIVVPVETDSTCAIAASYEAKAFGIKTGTPVWQAKKICPGIICVHARHDGYVRFHDRLIEEIDKYIPVASVRSIDEMACRLMGREQLPENATTIARRIKDGIARNVGAYVRCSIGIAPNLYLSKVATDLQKPDGLTVLMPDDLPHRLLSLQLRDLPGIGANMEARLNQAGIHDMKKLLSLPPKQLRAVWGSVWGEKMWYWLRGHDLPESETERSSIGHSHVLAPELRPPAHAWHVARRLTIKAAARLRRLEYCTGNVTLSIRLENGPRRAAEAGCRHATDTFTLLETLSALWQAVTEGLPPQARIKKVSVTFSRLAENGQVQPDLFDQAAESESDNRTRARREKISAAMDALNHKFGRDTILPGMLPSQGKGFTGTKIAFTRIPDIEEFLE